jgi:hypothetical protein
MVAADRNDNVPAGRNKTSRKHFQFLEWKNGSETARFEGTLEYSLAVYNTLNDPAMKLYINHLERAWPITSRTDFAVDDSDSEIEEPNSESDH